MSEKLIAYFAEGVNEIQVDGLTQWDKDRVLSIQFADMPKLFEVHLSYPSRATAKRLFAENVDGVAVIKIPNEFLQQRKTISAWIYTVDANGCQTVKTITMPLELRTKPDDYASDPDPSQKDIVQELIEKTNKLIEDAEKVIDKGDILSSTARIANVSLTSAGWVGDTSPFSQIVEIEGVTPYSQVDLTPSIEQLSIFYQKDLALVTENENGVVTVYALGDKPQNDYTIQATITEVSV